MPPLVCMFLNAKRQAAERVRWRADAPGRSQQAVARKSVSAALPSRCNSIDRRSKPSEQNGKHGWTENSTRAAPPRTAPIEQRVEDRAWCHASGCDQHAINEKVQIRRSRPRYERCSQLETTGPCSKTQANQDWFQNS